MKGSQAVSDRILFICFKGHLLQEAFSDYPRVPSGGSQMKPLLMIHLQLLFQGKSHGFVLCCVL